MITNFRLDSNSDALRHGIKAVCFNPERRTWTLESLRHELFEFMNGMLAGYKKKGVSNHKRPHGPVGLGKPGWQDWADDDYRFNRRSATTAGRDRFNYGSFNGCECLQAPCDATNRSSWHARKRSAGPGCNETYGLQGQARLDHNDKRKRRGIDMALLLRDHRFKFLLKIISDGENHLNQSMTTMHRSALKTPLPIPGEMTSAISRVKSEAKSEMNANMKEANQSKSVSFHKSAVSFAKQIPSRGSEAFLDYNDDGGSRSRLGKRFGKQPVVVLKKPLKVRI